MVVIHLKLNPLHPRTLCAKFGPNELSGSEDFLIFIVPLKKGHGPSFEQT